jgi:hypothetical protein
MEIEELLGAAFIGRHGNGNEAFKDMFKSVMESEVPFDAEKVIAFLKQEKIKFSPCDQVRVNNKYGGYLMRDGIFVRYLTDAEVAHTVIREDSHSRQWPCDCLICMGLDKNNRPLYYLENSVFLEKVEK